MCIRDSGDTARMSADSSLNENLSLVPIDEAADGKKASTSSSGLHDDKPESAREKDSDENAGDSRIDEKELERYGSGPLDALLGDKKFNKSVKLPKTQLTTNRDDEKSYTWIWIVAGAVLAVVGGAIAVMMLAAK